MNLILPLRIAQAILAIIVLGLSAYCTDVATNYAEADFLVFCSVWSIVVLAYLLLTPMFFPDMHNRWVVVGGEAVTMIFWFAGFIAIAASIDKVWCIGPGCGLLGAAKAAAVFGAFSWICWAVTCGLIVHALVTHGKSADSEAGTAVA